MQKCCQALVEEVKLMNTAGIHLRKGEGQKVNLYELIYYKRLNDVR